jgi:steroid 5-alpha reductase family enzyme
MKAFLGIATSGLLCQIVGDTHKSIAKSRGVSLVTNGLFSVLRHPNYTGEAILWSFSAAAGLLMACTATSKTLIVNTLSIFSILGALGIL